MTELGHLAPTIGDIALVRDERGDALSRLATRSRGTGWTTAWRSDGWLLAVDPPSADWAGHACTVHRLAKHDAVLIGRLTSPASATQDLDRVLSSAAQHGASQHGAEGSWLLLARDRTTGEWQVASDRFGTLHGFRTTGTTMAVGTHAAAVAAVGSAGELDWEALWSMFAHGFLPGDRTQLLDVTAIRPARLESIDGARSHRWWQWPCHVDPDLTHEEALEALETTLGSIIAEQMPSVAEGRLAVPVSGGLDSRTVLAHLVSAGVEPNRLSCFSYGYGPDSIETRIAGQVGAAVGLPVATHEVPATMFDQIERIVAATDGQVDPTLPRQAAMIDAIATGSCRVTAAHWGDVWLDDLGLSDAHPESSHPESDAATVVAHAGRRLRKPGAELLEPLVVHHLDGTSPSAILTEQLASAHREVAHVGHPDWQVTALKTDQWSFRSTVTGLKVHRAGLEPVMPFYDGRIAELMTRIPRSSVRGRRLQVDHILAMDKRLGRVTWQAKEIPLALARHNDTFLVPLRAARHLWRRARPPRRTLRNWEVQFAGPDGAAGLRRWLLDDGLRLHDLMPLSHVSRLVDELQTSPTAAHGHAVASLLGFSVWLETLA